MAAKCDLYVLSIVIGFLALLITIPGTGFADVSLIYLNDTTKKKATTISVVEAVVVAKMVGQDGISHRLIFNSKTDSVYLVLDTEKQYMDLDSFVRSLDNLSHLFNKMLEVAPSGAETDINAALKELSSTSGTDNAVSPVIKSDQNKEIVAGIPCRQVVVEGTYNATEYCLAGQEAIGISIQDYSLLRTYFIKVGAYADQMASMVSPALSQLSLSIFEDIPIKIGPHRDSRGRGGLTLGSINRTVDASIATIPDDYSAFTLYNGE